MSRQKQLSVVFVVANAQKQGVIRARPVLTSSTTMFQERAPSRARGKGISMIRKAKKLNISRCSAVGSAPVSGTGGLEFESPHFDQKKKRALVVLFSFFMLVWMMRTSLCEAERSSHTPRRCVKLACKYQA